MPKILVLIADDEILVAQTLAEILNGEGFEAIAVADGAAAVQLARERKPDIAICDVVMPRLNGIEAAKQIRQIAPKTRILLFSGQAATTGLLEEAENEGFNFEILAKPVKPEFLLATIGRLLDIDSSTHATSNKEES